MPNNKDSAPFDAGYIRHEPLRKGQKLPPVLPVVLYGGSGSGPLQRSVAIWLNRLLRVRFNDETIPELQNLNDKHYRFINDVEIQVFRP